MNEIVVNQRIHITIKESLKKAFPRLRELAPRPEAESRNLGNTF